MTQFNAFQLRNVDRSTYRSDLSQQPRKVQKELSNDYCSELGAQLYLLLARFLNLKELKRWMCLGSSISVAIESFTFVRRLLCVNLQEVAIQSGPSDFNVQQLDLIIAHPRP